MKKELRRLSAAIGRILRRANKRNDQLEAFRGSESFKQFQSNLESGLNRQARWVRKNIKDIAHVLENPELDDHTFESKIGKWLFDHMPPLSDFVSKVRIYTYARNAFVEAVMNQYKMAGVITKAANFTVNFELTNPYYIAQLNNIADYLLHRSKLDETTMNNLITMFKNARLDSLTIDETADMIDQLFPDIAYNRAFMIANTESNRAMSQGQMAFMTENKVPTKSWVGAGAHTCDICDGNVDDGEIGIDESFSSGDSEPPAHPNCECYLEAGKIDLDSIDLWDGS